MPSAISDSPFPVEFQEEIFGYLMSDRQAMAHYSPRIKPSFFEDPATSSLWMMAKGHFEKYHATPTKGAFLETIRRAYSGQNQKDVDQRQTMMGKVSHIMDIPSTAIPFASEKLGEFIGWAAMREVFIEGGEDIMKGVFNPGIIKKFQEAARAGEVITDIGTFARHGAVVATERHADHDLDPPIPTGLFHLDLELGGGLKRGQLGFFMAPPKGSKSTFLLNVAHNVPTMGVRKNCLYLTLELSEELQCLRFAIRTAMLEKSMIIRDVDRYIELYRRKAAAIFSPNHDCLIKFMEPYSCTPNKIRTMLENLRDNHNFVPDVLCVDYFELLGSDEKLEKDYMAQTRIATSLRQIAIDFKAAVWTASRTNREAENAIRSGKWITPAHMSGAYEKLGVCDVAIAGQRYRDGMAIVPIAFRNEGGNRKVNVALHPSKMFMSTRGWISDDETPEGDDPDEDDKSHRKRKEQKKPGSSFPDRKSKAAQLVL